MDLEDLVKVRSAKHLPHLIKSKLSGVGCGEGLGLCKQREKGRGPWSGGGGGGGSVEPFDEGAFRRQQQVS